MANGNFVFLGYREYDVEYPNGHDTDPADAHLVSRDGTGLGLLRDAAPQRRRLGDLGPQLAQRAVSPVPFVNLTKTNQPSTVHRNLRMDYVGVKDVDLDGRVLGERRFLGLWTASAYTRSALDIPVLRSKVAEVLARSGAVPLSHQANQLINILERYPRDELFQIRVDDLYEHARGILAVNERRIVRLFVRPDDYGRFWSALVFVPRDRFDTATRLRIQELLQDVFGADRLTFTTQIDDSALARLHVTLYTPGRSVPPVDIEALERRIARLTRSWSDDLQMALVEGGGEDRGLARHQRWSRAFPAAYQEDISPAAAVRDIARVEGLNDDDIDVELYHPRDTGPEIVRLKVFRSGSAIHLSDVLPILRDHGVTVLDERPYRLRDITRSMWIYDFGLALPEAVASQSSNPSFGARFEQSFLAAWRGETESDGLNRLVIEAGLDHRQVLVARALRRFMHQLGVRYSDAYFEQTLVGHAALVQLAVELFRARFDPTAADPERERQLDAQIDRELASIVGLDADRILQGFRNLIRATVRTNFYQQADGGRTPPCVAFKIDPGRITDMPLPRPAHEIFVYAPRVEGVHLRMGAVARGGIRWSDRREDFRTEILGLMKAQNVKNAVIVPVGAKGGFVLKRPPADPAGLRAEVKACYQMFIGALLDVTDNLVEGAVVPPPGLIRHDRDDPYLVVAADKGTASFSDTANEISMARGYWLGDAFASGGSTGYDHKGMGITARGAWESVTRHLRELGVDPAQDQFSVVGIGDMSGDVFGNGMLLSDRIRLVAAFDHRHIFVDPVPDPSVSFDERQRLFDLPTSSWADYDPARLSPGGGVFDRTVKAIVVTPEMREVLRITAESLTPPQLISAILCSPVDLLWNGGIGTYVKARSEGHDDVGDRANDGVRVDGGDLRCRVVGEGGNLGFTQLGRVEFAMTGGRINTDFIDNSGGVDCSDHEVNLKVLLDREVAIGELTVKHRNELLATMTDEVAGLVLEDNAAQSLALSLARIQAPRMVDVHVRQLAWLERVAGLNRDLEGFPSDESLMARRAEGRGLTQPELAVLLAYTKNALTEAVLDSTLPDDPAFDDELLAYFPAAVRERFGRSATEHPLRRELIATIVVNDLVNRSGMSMAVRLAEETSAPFDEIIKAFLVAWKALDLDRHRDELLAAEDTLPAEAVLAAHLEIKQLGERGTRWVLRNRRFPIDVDRTVDQLASGVATIRGRLPDWLPPVDRTEQEEIHARLTATGVPDALATEMAELSILYTTLDIVDVSVDVDRPLDSVARSYFALDDDLQLAPLRRWILALPRLDRWSANARSALRDDLLRAHADLVASILRESPATGGDDSAVEAPFRVAAWLIRHTPAVDRWRRVMSDLREVVAPDINHLSVAVRELRNLIHQVAGSTRQ